MSPWMLLYNTLLTAALLGTAPLWSGLLAVKPKSRAGFLQRASGDVPPLNHASPRPIWYHAVSVGEVMASLALVREIAEGLPGWPIWISTVTAPGQETARSRVPQAAGIFYFPYDLPWIVDRVIHRLRPALFITTETEIWPNCVVRLHRHGSRVALVNGRISDRSFGRYRRFRFFFKGILGCFDRLCMQSEKSAERIIAMGAPASRVHVTGNLKFDQALPDPVDQQIWRRRLGLGENGPVWVAGSTHPGEEEIILRVFRRLRSIHPDFRLVLAPRAPERFDEVECLIASAGLSVQRRSEPPGEQGHGGVEVILLDTIGELGHVYGVARVGFVGGSLVPHGGQNPLEVAAHGRPALFGPHMENFREIAALLVEGGGAMEVRNEVDLEQGIRKCLADPCTAKAMGHRGYATLLANRGAASRTLEVIRTLTERSSWA